MVSSCQNGYYVTSAAYIITVNKIFKKIVFFGDALKWVGGFESHTANLMGKFCNGLFGTVYI